MLMVLLPGLSDDQQAQGEPDFPDSQQDSQIISLCLSGGFNYSYFLISN